MNRRNFIRNIIASGAGIAATQIGGKFAFGEGLTPAYASLSVVTDQPALALKELQQVAARLNLPDAALEFSEHQLRGRHLSDLLFIENGQIQDYKRLQTVTARMLRKSAQRLGLMTPVENPSVLTISAGRQPAKAAAVQVFRGNVLAGQYAISKNTSEQVVAGARGEIAFHIKDGRAAMTGATCKHQTCLKLGAIDTPGQSIVCIPNQVRIAISGRPASGVDTIAF